MTVKPEWEAYLQTHRERFLAELVEFLRIPSISALSAHAGDVARAASWVFHRLQKAGLHHVQVLATGGHPVVYGDWLLAPDKPTVLIYGHFDIQPVDPLAQWESPPFDPVIRAGHIYARGASDDKGNMLSPVAAVEALLAGGGLPVNVKFLFEGQEEIGSPQLPEFLARQRDLLACDLVVSADGLQWSPDQPKIDLGFRGIAAFQIDVRGPAADQHSGLYGGVLHNPNQALSRILASFHDAQGRILVEGFYDDVLDLSAEDRIHLAELPFEADRLADRLQVPELFGPPEYAPLERIGARPTLEICGMGGGFQGEGMKSIIPACAQAKISCRLVADQRPERIIAAVRRHVKRIPLPGVRVEIREIPGSAVPYLMPADHAGIRAAANVLETLYGTPPYLTREGGSIAACALFLKELGAYTVSFSFSCADENLHAPNEFFRIESMERGQKGYVLLLMKLGEELGGGTASSE
ncbi:dipeptidase [Desulfococcus sp.]|uniref:dipeptidase n=1 Tax=Desulfococcus sp. TaxID=2025834 RepID=UPI003593BFFF